MTKPTKAAIDYMEEAAETLEGLNGVLDRARDGAGDLHDEAQELQADVWRVCRRAINLHARMQGKEPPL